MLVKISRFSWLIYCETEVRYDYFESVLARIQNVLRVKNIPHCHKSTSGVERVERKKWKVGYCQLLERTLSCQKQMLINQMCFDVKYWSGVGVQLGQA